MAQQFGSQPTNTLLGVGLGPLVLSGAPAESKGALRVLCVVFFAFLIVVKSYIAGYFSNSIFIDVQT